MVDDLFDEISESSGAAFVVRLHVQPGAGRTSVVGRHGDAVKVRVAAPPEQGRANDACATLLASMLGVQAGDVELTAGASSRSKRFKVRGIDRERLADRLEIALEEATVGRGPGRRGRGDFGRPI